MTIGPPSKAFVRMRSVKRRDEIVCAVCGYTQADLKVGPNYFHAECKDMLDHEYHAPPERLVPMNRSKE